MSEPLYRIVYRGSTGNEWTGRYQVWSEVLSSIARNRLHRRHSPTVYGRVVRVERF